mmetsp:Transcript_59265/g.183716  ORF Transcript_59265/g.183716 Transcript_59265/m.183716 type:complete len:558 (-) Transcript_59265:419-2092(-)
MPRVRRRDGGRRDVETPPPDLHHLVAVLCGGLRLVEPLEPAVVPLVQPPGVDDGHGEVLRLHERSPCGADGAPEHGGEDDVEAEAGRLEHLACLQGLQLPRLAQVDVRPAREDVLHVPVALPMTEEDNLQDDVGLLRSGVQDSQGLLTHDRAVFHSFREVLRGNVSVTGVGGVVLAVGGEALGDAHAGAVELAHDPLLLLCGRAYGRCEDEVRGPPERDGFAGKAERRHDLGEVPGEEVVREVLELGLLRRVEGVHGASPANGRDAALLGLLVDDAHEGVADHVVAQLAFHDARAEALVDELAAGCLAALEVPASPFGGPIPRLAGATADAELDELAHGVFLGVVVVGLHHVELVIVRTALFAERLAILARLQLDDPDALPGGSAVLFDHAWLESHCLLETRGELLGSVVCQCVLQSDLELCNLAERILGAHKFHDIRARPHLLAQLAHLSHGIVELALVAAIGLDLAGVATHDECIELLSHLEELVVLVVHVMNQLAAHAGADHPVGNWDGVVAVAVGALVAAPVGLGAHVDAHERSLETWPCWLRQQAQVVLGDP